MAAGAGTNQDATAQGTSLDERNVSRRHRTLDPTDALPSRKSAPTRRSRRFVVPKEATGLPCQSYSSLFLSDEHAPARDSKTKRQDSESD